jgi:hypothetical protein
MTTKNAKEKAYNKGCPSVLIRHIRINTSIVIIIHLTRIRLIRRRLVVIPLLLISGSGRHLPVARLAGIITSPLAGPSLLFFRLSSLPAFFKSVAEGLRVS